MFPAAAPIEPVVLPDLDYGMLNKDLDKVKSRVFLGKNSAFLSSLMAEMEFHWSEDEETAATDGENFWWNPRWYLSLPFKTRETVFVHELWHPGLLHFERMGNRDPLIWNYATDIRINNGLENDDYSFEGTSPWLDQSYGLMAEEDIYDDLIKKGVKPPPNSNTWGKMPQGAGKPGDMRNSPVDVSGTLDKARKQRQIGRVIRAYQAAEKAGQAGDLPGNLSQTIQTFLSPVLPWEQLLQRWFTDLLDEDYTMARPNRRYMARDLYMASRYEDIGRLDHVLYCLDVSGSISDKEILRFTSEVHYLWNHYKPRKLTLLQFDSKIQRVDVMDENNPMDIVKIQGRGGTKLGPVREYILEHKPTAVVIFSDLICNPMQKIDNIPVIWACTTDRQGSFGQTIKIPRAA